MNIWIRASLAGAAMLAFAPASMGQTPPAPSAEKSMHFIVPFPAGGTLDVLARAVCNELGPALGRTIVVENKPGASGVIGAQVVARAPADGSTLFIASNTLVTLPALRKSLPFDVFKDFEPVIMLGETPTLITVHASFPARDYASFVAAVKANGGLHYNSPGIASAPHLGGELLARAANLPLTHVPYRGTQPAVNDLVSGQVKMMMAPLNAVLPFIENKTLVAIALTDAQRTSYLPSAPTLHELGVTNMPAVSSWFAILTTGGTPADTVQRLNREITKILNDPKVKQSLASQTFQIKPGSPADLARVMREDAATNARIISEAGIPAE